MRYAKDHPDAFHGTEDLRRMAKAASRTIAYVRRKSAECVKNIIVHWTQYNPLLVSKGQFVVLGELDIKYSTPHCHFSN